MDGFTVPRTPRQVRKIAPRVHLPGSHQRNLRQFCCVSTATTPMALTILPYLHRFIRKKNLTFCLVDDRAHGRSDGHYIGFSFHDRYDCLTWANYLANRFGPDCRIFLHGLSMGAATVLSCSNSDHLPSQVKGIISDARLFQRLGSSSPRNESPAPHTCISYAFIL